MFKFFKIITQAVKKIETCELGHQFPVYHDSSTGNDKVNMECSKCEKIMILSVPYDMDFKEVQTLEKKLPSCNECGGKLFFSDAWGKGVPKKCPTCGHAWKTKPFNQHSKEIIELADFELTGINYER